MAGTGTGMPIVAGVDGDGTNTDADVVSGLAQVLAVDPLTCWSVLKGALLAAADARRRVDRGLRAALPGAVAAAADADTDDALVDVAGPVAPLPPAEDAAALAAGVEPATRS